MIPIGWDAATDSWSTASTVLGDCYRILGSDVTLIAVARESNLKSTAISSSARNMLTNDSNCWDIGSDS